MSRNRNAEQRAAADALARAAELGAVRPHKAMKAKSRILIAILIGVALTGAAASRLPYLDLLATPGAFLASGLGAGTVHEPGPSGLTTTVSIIWLGTLVVWSGVAYGALAFHGRRREA
jgi:hypothetical protein